MRNESFISPLLCKLYALPIAALRAFIRTSATKLEGGQMHSKTLRRIFRDYHKIDVGMYSYGGCFNKNLIWASTKIGRYCSFADGVHIFNRNHPLKFKATHPFFFNAAFGYVKNETVPIRQIEIGHDVWVGENALIMPSVKSIGNGAVIGAGSVVTKDIPDFAVVAGNPAKIIKFRFPHDAQEKIRKSNWWNKDIDELKNNLDEFTCPLVEKDNDEF